MKWLVGRWWFWAILVGTLFGLPLVRVFMREAPAMPPVLGQVPDKKLMREGGRELPLGSLAGKVWIASRFSSDDATTAMQAMHALEKRMRKLGEAFMLVSLAVDPARDTPEALVAWAHDHRTNPRRRALVTGPIEDLKEARSALRLDPSRLAADPLVLVDAAGKIRGIYDSSQKDHVDQLVSDAALLVNAY
jgi:cytochrome oxidase Cu insertion factor (SCO1/SenC/PrrC family)